jgi:hypothetical protein
MKADTLAFVKSCTTCQQAKPNRSKYPGLFSPLPVPDGAYHTISMDFIKGIPRSGSVNCILVIVDKFSKYNHFVPLLHPFTAAKVAEAFLHHVYRCMVCQWQELFKLAGVKLLMSSAYHPQTDDQTKRVNQRLETFLLCFVHSCPKQWSKWVSLAGFWYNSSYHSALGHSPFEVLYGHQPRHFGIHISDT